MELAGAAASITGILAFTGQAIEGIITLKSLFTAYSNSSKSVSRLLSDLNCLIQILDDVKAVAEKLDNSSKLEAFCAPRLLLALSTQLQACGEDVAGWVKKAGDMHPDFSTGWKQSVRKFLVAVGGKEKMGSIYVEVKQHQMRIAVRLQVIGRMMDAEHSSDLKLLNTKVETTTAVTLAALEGLQDSFNQDFKKREDSIDLASIASSLSRLESMVGSQRGSRSRPNSVSSWHGSASSAVSAQEARKRATLREVEEKSRADLLDRSTVASNEFTRIRTREDGLLCTNCFSDWYKLAQVPLKYEPLCTRCQEEFSYQQLMRRAAIAAARKDVSPPLTEDTKPYTNSKTILKYIVLVQRRAAFHAQLRCVTALAFSLPEKVASFSNHKVLTDTLNTLSNEIRQLRAECWTQGENIDDLDVHLGGLVSTYDNICPFATINHANDQSPPPVSLSHNFQALRPTQRASTTNLDRINAWLLHKLHSLPGEATLHKSILATCLSTIPDPSKTAHAAVMNQSQSSWLQTVERSWFLDGAAEAGHREIGPSTNGAVDSSGRPHAERVDLGVVENVSVEGGGIGGMELQVDPLKETLIAVSEA